MPQATTLKHPTHPFWFIAFALLAPWLVAFILVSDVHEAQLNSRLGWTIIFSGFFLVAARWLSARLLLLPLLVIGSVDLSYAISFHGVFSTSTFEAIAATDISESSEFLMAYLSIENSLALLAYWLVGIWLWRQMRPTSASKGRFVWISIAFILLIFAIQTLGSGKITDIVPGVIGAAIKYEINTEGVEQERANRLALTQAYDKSQLQFDDQAKTWIVVIGESMQRQHLSLYGYPRQTTPKLDALKDELLIFTDVISSHVQTQPSLRYALTLANVRDKSDPLQSLSIVDLANLTGMETFWLSNQQPLRGTTSAIARQAKHEYYVSNDYAGVSDTLDELLLPKIADALAHPATQKLIIVHLMGSHLQYENRYPRDFTVFSGQPPQGYQTGLSQSQINAINQYDTSIRYTDGVLANIIAQAKAQTQPTGVVFFADHGEEIYDTKNFKGHGPESLTSRMFTVPFLLWGNQPMRQQQQTAFAHLAATVNAPWKHDHFEQLLSEVAGWHYPQRRLADTLGSADYLPSPRMVYGQDFDTVFGE